MDFKEASESYDFDRVIVRRGTDSTKWGRFEQDVLPLWVADMDFPSAPKVREVLRERVEHGVFGYGFEPPELRGVIQERLLERFGWQTKPEDYSFLPGVYVGFNQVAQAFAGPGDGVLIQTPIYPPILAVPTHGSHVLNAAPLAKAGDRYEIDFDVFERAITSHTRVFVLCNPHNPVGRVFTRAELERMAEICLRHNVVICSDEIHQDFVYSGNTHIPIASLSPEVAAQTVTLISPSKSYNIAGFHFAIAVATNPEIRARLEATGSGLIPHRPGILDFIAGLTAYKYGGEWLKGVVGYLEGNRDFLVKYVRENLPGVRMGAPEGTYLGWLDCREAGIESSPVDFFLEKARVAFNPGQAFGQEGEGFVRLNFGCPRSILTEALERMKGALERDALRA